MTQGQDSWKQGDPTTASEGAWNDRAQRDYAAGRPDRSGPAQRHEPARQGPAAGQPEPTGPAEPLISRLHVRSPSFGRGFFMLRPGGRARPSGSSPARLEREGHVEGGIQVGVRRGGLVPAVDEDGVPPGDRHVLAGHVTQEHLARTRARATVASPSDPAAAAAAPRCSGRTRRGPSATARCSDRPTRSSGSRPSAAAAVAVTSTIRNWSSRMKIGGPLAVGQPRCDLDPVVCLELQPVGPVRELLLEQRPLWPATRGRQERRPRPARPRPSPPRTRRRRPAAQVRRDEPESTSCGSRLAQRLDEPGLLVRSRAHRHDAQVGRRLGRQRRERSPDDLVMDRPVDPSGRRNRCAEEPVLLVDPVARAIESTSRQTVTMAASTGTSPSAFDSSACRAPTMRLSSPGTSRAARASRPRSSRSALASVPDGRRPRTMRRIIGRRISRGLPAPMAGVAPGRAGPGSARRRAALGAPRRRPRRTVRFAA